MIVLMMCLLTGKTFVMHRATAGREESHYPELPAAPVP